MSISWFILFQLSKIYNKVEEDFEHCDDYDLYLEEVECLVYNLTNDIDKAETERKIEAYERLHKDEIKKNYNRRWVL